MSAYIAYIGICVLVFCHSPSHTRLCDSLASFTSFFYPYSLSHPKSITVIIFMWNYSPSPQLTFADILATHFFSLYHIMVFITLPPIIWHPFLWLLNFDEVIDLTGPEIHVYYSNKHKIQNINLHRLIVKTVCTLFSLSIKSANKLKGFKDCLETKLICRSIL